ncbi:MAG: helix-turn-helix domain-containing protein [Pseudomonadota bacterium]
MARRIVISPTPQSFELRSVANLGAWVRNRRTQLNLRIDDAAALCGVTVQMLSDLETGKRAARFDLALKVANELGLALLAIPKQQMPDLRTALGKAQAGDNE